jgi:hypothetical protein
MFVESSIKANALGVTMTRRVKRIGCSGIKDLIEQGKLKIQDSQTIVEMSTFVSKGNSFMAIAPNHDDLMMNLVLFAWFTTTDIFESLTNINMKDLLYKERLKEIQDDMLPFGFVESDNLENERDKYTKDADGNVWMEVEWKGSHNI